jgi:hypothetical protein
MKIALLSSLNFHQCCLAFLFELFKEHDIYVYFPEDQHNFLKYYRLIYPDVNIVLKNITEFIKTDYNLCIKITSYDSIISCDGIISIAHLKRHVDNYNKYISMCPWINGKNNIFYFFPLYRGIKNISYNNVITYIGCFINDFLDEDTRNFIKNNNNFLFYFICGDIIPEFKNYSNVRNCGQISTFDMVDIIKQSKFILTRKEPFQSTDRYSGSIGHSVSHGKPMIIQKYTADSYNLPGVVFNTNYCEITDKINNMSEEEYNKHIQDLEEFSQKTFISNNDTLKKLLT